MDVVRADRRCPHCGLTALDDEDPVNRDAIDYVRVARSHQRTKEWHAFVIAGAVVALPLIAALTSDNPVSWLPVIAVIAVVGVVIVAGRESDERWREPGHATRLLTSTIAISIVINVVFAGIKDVEGIEALWYAPGDPLWRVVTATFTHSNAMHLIGNLIATLMFGFAVDLRIGRVWTAVVLAVTMSTAWLAQSFESDGPGVGFSGCVYGLFGAALALMPMRSQLLRIQAVVIPLPMWAWMFVMVTAFTVVDALDPSRRVAWAAHLGGFFGGLLLGLALRRVPPSQRFLRDEERRRGMVTAAARSEGFDDLIPGADGPAAASSNPEIAAFHRAARRKRTVVTLVGGGLMLVLGLGAAALAASMDAPPQAEGRRIMTIVVGLVMGVLGLGMIASQLKSR